MPKLSQVKYPYLNELELECLAASQAQELNEFTRQQHRRDKVYEEHTVPVDRPILEDRTPNGSIDTEAKWQRHLASEAVNKGWTARQAETVRLSDAGHTQAEIAKQLGVHRDTIAKCLKSIRGRGKKTGCPHE